MLKVISSIVDRFKNISTVIRKSNPSHPYRLISINQDETGNYLAEIQLVNKSHTFTLRPEEILANDKMTDAFSQRDIRTLTYLGYLEMNAPKYKILAKRLSEKDNKLLFAIKERGNNKTIIRTANEITQDEKIIAGLDQKDAHSVGYATGSEHAAMESEMKKEAEAEESRKN